MRNVSVSDPADPHCDNKPSLSSPRPPPNCLLSLNLILTLGARCLAMGMALGLGLGLALAQTMDPTLAMWLALGLALVSLVALGRIKNALVVVFP